MKCPVDFFRNYNLLLIFIYLITINSDFLFHCIYHHFIHQTIAIIQWYNFKTVTVTIYNVSCIFLSLRYFFCSCMQDETLIEQRQVLIFPLPLTPINVLSLFISWNEKRNDLIWLIMIYEYLNNFFPKLYDYMLMMRFIKHRRKLFLNRVLSYTFCLDDCQPSFTLNSTVLISQINYVKNDTHT